MVSQLSFTAPLHRMTVATTLSSTFKKNNSIAPLFREAVFVCGTVRHWMQTSFYNYYQLLSLGWLLKQRPGKAPLCVVISPQFSARQAAAKTIWLHWPNSNEVMLVTMETNVYEWALKEGTACMFNKDIQHKDVRTTKCIRCFTSSQTD